MKLWRHALGFMLLVANLAGCATTPAADQGLANQVTALRQQVAQLSALVQRQQQQDYEAGITMPPPAGQSQQTSPAGPPADPPQPAHSIAPPTQSPSGQGAGPFVNVHPKNMDLPAPDPSAQVTAKTYAVYLPFTDLGTLQRVDAFLDAHGITDRKDATDNGQLAIYLGVYADRRAAQNRQQQIVDETGLQPQIAVIGN